MSIMIESPTANAGPGTGGTGPVEGVVGAEVPVPGAPEVAPEGPGGEPEGLVVPALPVPPAVVAEPAAEEGVVGGGTTPAPPARGWCDRTAPERWTTARPARDRRRARSAATTRRSDRLIADTPSSLPGGPAGGGSGAGGGSSGGGAGAGGPSAARRVAETGCLPEGPDQQGGQRVRRAQDDDGRPPARGVGGARRGGADGATGEEEDHVGRVEPRARLGVDGEDELLVLDVDGLDPEVGEQHAGDEGQQLVASESQEAERARGQGERAARHRTLE